MGLFFQHTLPYMNAYKQYSCKKVQVAGKSKGIWEHADGDNVVGLEHTIYSDVVVWKPTSNVVLTRW